MASTDIDFQPARPRQEGLAAKWHGFKTFCYNPDGGTFCGRTGKSWLKITVFYLIYYGCLAAFSVAMMAIFFTTLDDNEPKQQGMQSLIKGNPGLAFRPMPNTESTLIKFRSGEAKTYAEYVKAIDKYLENYSDEKVTEEGETISCAGGRPEGETKPCKFDMADLGSWCTKDNSYGFFEGQPCIILKMNRVFGWVPDVYVDNTEAPAELQALYNRSDEALNIDNSLPITCQASVFGWEPVPYDNDTNPAPAHIADKIVPGFIPVTCEGEQNSDIDAIGEIEFYPPGGFPVSFFPYSNQPGYRSPILMIRFKKPVVGSLIQVWCKVWAQNIYHHKNDKAGSSRFEILIN